MSIKLSIAGYCRISVDEELDRDNTSIENQKAIIGDFVARKFPDSVLDFYEDRDRSGYTFEQREDYQLLRKKMLEHEYDILIVKDFSRFSRRNSKGLVELEDLRDAGMRIISIGDNIDYPTYDDWTAIQFRFLINEMPVTDTSKKVKSVIKRRQEEGKWICAVPYGYVMDNYKAMTFSIDEPAAEVVREIFKLYNEGWGYKKIANHLTEKHIPTPRMCEKMRKEAMGEEYHKKVRPEWSIITISEILSNDFYIGTLRQGKYKRKRINGGDEKVEETDHIVFENNHEPIVDFRTFAAVQEQLKKRSTSNYRGVKKYDNVYSGYLYCGDCGAPMFAMSRADLAPAYTCGTYHRRGTKGCTSHHTRVDLLDDLLKSYVRKVRDNSAEMIERLQKSIADEKVETKNSQSTIEILNGQIENAKSELKILSRQKARDILKHPEREEILEETYGEMLDELTLRIEGLKNQLAMTTDKHNSIIKVNRVAKTVLEIFDDILNKPTLQKSDLDFILEKIIVYTDRIEIYLKADIDALLQYGELAKEPALVGEASANFNSDVKNISYESRKIVVSAKNRKDKVFSVNVICNGDPLEIFTSNDGEVVFKKYSPLGEIANFSSMYADVLHKTGGLPVIVCDKDHVVSVAGIPKKEILERRISPLLEDAMLQRKNISYTDKNHEPIRAVEGVDRYAVASALVIVAGDVCGAIIFLSGDSESVATDLQIKLVDTAASLLAKQLEE